MLGELLFDLRLLESSLCKGISNKSGSSSICDDNLDVLLALLSNWSLFGLDRSTKIYDQKTEIGQ